MIQDEQIIFILHPVSCIMHLFIDERTERSLASFYERARGKSELLRAGRWVTPRCCEATESATENKPPDF